MSDLNPQIEDLPPVPLLIVISGPSGVGKDTMVMRLGERGVPFHFVVTATSRPMRPGELDGRDYHFYSKAQFERMIEQGELLEWALVYGHYKGIPKREIRDALLSGRDVVLRVDVQGAATMRRLVPNAVQIFVMPGNMDELRDRLAGRSTETPEEIGQRMAVARGEIERIREFEYVVFNRAGQQDAAVAQIQAIVLAEKQRVFPRKIIID